MRPERGALWPWAMAAVLVLTIGGNLAVMRIATSDPSVAVVPEYYRKAVLWDSTLAEQRRTEALGWHARLSLRETAEGFLVTVTLLDSLGAPLAADTLGLEAFHVARAAEVFTPAASRDRDDLGTWYASIPSQRQGLWEIRLTARKDGQEAVLTSRLDSEAR